MVMQRRLAEMVSLILLASPGSLRVTAHNSRARYEYLPRSQQQSADSAPGFVGLDLGVPRMYFTPMLLDTGVE